MSHHPRIDTSRAADKLILLGLRLRDKGMGVDAVSKALWPHRDRLYARNLFHKIDNESEEC